MISPNSIEQYTISKYYFMTEKEVTPNEVMETARKDIFGSITYPFYVETNSEEGKKIQKEFENYFIQWFFTRPWAQETSGLFKIRLQQKLTQIMPYYSQIYYSTTFEFDPLINRKYSRDIVDSEVQHSETNENNDTLANNNGNSQSIHSNNPQTNFAGIDYASEMDRGQSKSDSNVKSNTNSNNNKNTNGTTTEQFSGFVGDSLSEQVAKWRKLIVNINERICYDCESLFSVFLTGE